MTAAPVRLLLLEDNRADAELLQAALAEFAPGGFAITHVERLADALARIQTGQFDALLSDLGLSDSTGLATVQAITARAPALPLVVLTGFDDDELGRAAIRHGAQDYLVKGEPSGALMGRTLRYAIERNRLEIGLRAANEALAGRVAERTAEIEAANAILLANAAGYRQLFDANPHPMYMFDPETLRFIAVNDAAVAHYGWSREEFLAMTIAEIRPAGEMQRVLDKINRFPQERIGQAGFVKHRKKDGTLIDVEIGSHVIEFGGRRARVAFAHDITERRRAEEALRESEARFRSLTEMSSDFYWETDVEHRFTVHIASAKLTQVWIFQRGTQIGQRRWEIPHLSPDEAGWQAHRAVLDAHRPFRDFVFSRRGTDGAERHYTVSGDPVFDASGAFKGYRGVGSDITERKHAEQALRAAEEQFRGLVEQSIAGIYIIQDGKFVYVNPRFAEIRGYDSADDMIGRDAISMIVEKDRDLVAENARRLLAGETKRVNNSFTALCKDGSTVEVGMQSTCASYSGRPAIIGMLQDISEKRRAEAEIQRYVAQLETAFMSTVGVATALSEMRDPYTAGHERRVAEIAVAIGAEIAFDARRQEGLRVAGHLHDIGKITIPSEILSKPGRLSPIEFKLIQGHAQASYDILKDVEFPWPVAGVALQHHERVDGSGYPQGLKGEAILLEARIMAVADVVEAMSSHRPYRPGLGIDKALAEIERGCGSVYDAAIADACLKLFREKGYTVPV